MSDYYCKKHLTGKKRALIFALSLSIIALASFCNSNCCKKAAVFAPEVGVCTSNSNAEVVNSANVDYIKASVYKILILQSTEEEFAPAVGCLRQQIAAINTDILHLI